MLEGVEEDYGKEEHEEGQGEEDHGEEDLDDEDTEEEEDMQEDYVPRPRYFTSPTVASQFAAARLRLHAARLAAYRRQWEEENNKEKKEYEAKAQQRAAKADEEFRKLMDMYIAKSPPPAE